jgi:hypothetical protein
MVNIDSQLDAGTILLAQSTLEKANIKSDAITLHYGGTTKELAIKIDNELNPDTFTIPKDLTAEISIPNLPFEVKLEENRLCIGPVIGFIPHTRNYTNLKKLLPRFSKYNEINGIIIIFQPSGINRLNKTIEGYYFDPGSKEFISGTFPYPKAVFTRKYLSEIYFSDFGGNLYNYPMPLDKLKFWSIMSKDRELKRHIPKTKVYKDLKRLLNMLNNYNSIYLKPYNLSRGRGILHLRKDDTGAFVLTDIFSNRNHIESEEELKKALKKKLKGTYLMQAEIPSIDKNKKIDFRAYFHKDQSKEWSFSGMEAKVAKEGSIISNFANRQKMMLGEAALSTIFKLEDEKIQAIKKELVQLCIRALTLVEENGFHLGEGAVDFVIDKQLIILLLEIQIDFASEKKLDRAEEERLLLPETLPASFNYAKALAGFGKS